MAEHRTPDHVIESSPRSFRCWFKNRLPPSPTLQAGSQLWMLVKICTSWQGGGEQKDGSRLASNFGKVDYRAGGVEAIGVFLCAPLCPWWSKRIQFENHEAHKGTRRKSRIIRLFVSPLELHRGRWRDA